MNYLFKWIKWTQLNTIAKLITATKSACTNVLSARNQKILKHSCPGFLIGNTTHRRLQILMWCFYFAYISCAPVCWAPPLRLSGLDEFSWVGRCPWAVNHMDNEVQLLISLLHWKCCGTHYLHLDSLHHWCLCMPTFYQKVMTTFGKAWAFFSKWCVHLYDDNMFVLKQSLVVYRRAWNIINMYIQKPKKNETIM